MKVQAVGPIGSVLVFNGQCWHGGGANKSDGVRRAIFAHYRVSPGCVSPWTRPVGSPRSSGAA